MSTGSVIRRLRERCDAEWEALHAHPFVRELAAGTLPLDAFRFYLEQNLQYLPEYARAMALAASRAADIATMRVFAAELAGVVESEIPTNAALLERAIMLGAPDTGGAAGPAPATVAYTSFLVATAARGGPLEVLAAIVPCTWSYGDIGARLNGQIVEHELYADWIGFFGSDDYARVVTTMRDDFDALAARDDTHSEEKLAELFVTAVRLEHGFWDMALARAHWPDVRG